MKGKLKVDWFATGLHRKMDSLLCNKQKQRQKENTVVVDAFPFNWLERYYYAY